eukprot:CAMPEP_0171915254 /NCGR_PEP_ID=MMETSP0993-20121228/13629_1 /TAXON_ID=483369 /ORGANISM="non described non described, Strain CCMP2098" /LENGTH=32 /DNA_ID= /DNA_START= /DNA_END= /DNA_ORIENTATION=
MTGNSRAMVWSRPSTGARAATEDATLARTCSD